MQGGRRGEVTEIVQNFYRFNIHKIHVSLCVCVCVCVCEAKSKSVWPEKQCQWGDSFKSIMYRHYTWSTSRKCITPSITQPMEFRRFKRNQSKLKLYSICMNVESR